MAEQSKDHQIIPLESYDGFARIREDAYINVLDLERLLPENSKEAKSWFKFMVRVREVLPTLAHRNDISVADMIQSEYDAKGEHFIWVQYDLALDYAASINPNLRADILITYRRVRTGDVTLADEILERSPEDEQDRWLRVRQELKRHTPLRNSAIKQHDGTEVMYIYCSDELNKATTGRTGREICALTHVRETRDALDTSHLALQLLGESEQIKAMEHKNAQGNNAIRLAVDPVHSEVKSIALHFNLHNDNLLYSRARFLLNRPPQERAALPSPEQFNVPQYPCRDYRETSNVYPEVLSQANAMEE